MELQTKKILKVFFKLKAKEILDVLIALFFICVMVGIGSTAVFGFVWSILYIIEHINFQVMAKWIIIICLALLGLISILVIGNWIWTWLKDNWRKAKEIVEKENGL